MANLIGFIVYLYRIRTQFFEYAQDELASLYQVDYSEKIVSVYNRSAEASR